MKPFYRHITLISALILGTLTVQAQTGVSINASGAAPDSEAILDISSTTKGLLVPRMTTAQRTAIATANNADDGMLVFDLNTETYWFWDGAASGAWQEFPTVANTGNTLDEAYDEGGPGAGRIIIADNGAVDIQDAGGLLVNGITGIGTSSPDASYKMTVLNGAGPTVKVAGTSSGLGLLVEANAGAEDGISSIHTSTANSSAYYAIRGEVTNESGEGYLGYHTSGDRSYGVYGADGTFAGYFEGNTNVASGNVGIGITSAATDKLVVSGGRAEITATTDANGSPGSGVLEIGNSLRIDGNEIITNTATTLYLNTDNNGDVQADGGTFYVDASTNRVGIGTTTPTQDLEISGNTLTTGDFYGDIHVDDTRFVNSPPTTYNNEVAFDFKQRAAVDAVPGSGTYSGMMTIAPWGDNSGDASHQINFNEGGLYWRQGQPDAASWGTWYKIITTADGLPTGSGTTNYLARWTPDGSTLGIGTTYDNGTNVGLGTTTPDEKLDVEGNLKVRNGAPYVNVSVDDESDGKIRFEDDDATASQNFEIAFNASDEDLHIRSDDNSGVDIITVLHEGNVGIGTTSPDAKLNVGLPTGATLYLTREDNTTNADDVLGSLLFDSTDDTSPSTTDASVVIRGHASQAHGNSNKGGYLTFLTKNNAANASAANERMRILANGNVGIGTTTPTALFDVQSSSQYPAVIHRTGNVGDVGIEFHDTDANSQTGYLTFDHRDANSIGNGASFHFKSSEANKAVIIDGAGGFYANTQLALRSNGSSYFTGGNVGVGTTGPAEAIHVIGTGRFSDLDVNANRLVYADTDGSLTISGFDPANLLDGSGTANYLARWTPDGNTLGIGATRDDGTNVGIGMAPQTGRRLSVSGDVYANGGSFIVSDLANNVDHIWNDDGNSSGTGNGSGTWNFVNDLAQGSLGNAGIRAGNLYMANAGNINYLAGNVGVGTTAPAAQLEVDGGTNTTVIVESDNGGASTISAYGTSQGTGRLYVGQSTTYGGGIEYNGDGSPVTTGAGCDYITLWRRSNSAEYWTARNHHSNNDWQFRANVDVDGYLTVGNPGTPTGNQSSDFATLYGWMATEGINGWASGSSCGSTAADWAYDYSNSPWQNHWSYDNVGGYTRKQLYTPWVWVPTGATGINCEPQFYCDLENNYDGVFMEYSTNGSTWTKITSWLVGGYPDNANGSNTTCNGTNNQSCWNGNLGDVSATSNNLSVAGNWVRFRFVGFEDGSVSSGSGFELYGFSVSAVLPSGIGGAFTSGDIYAENNIYAGSNVLLGDIAEYFKVPGATEPGDLISINPNLPDAYQVTHSAKDKYILGVHSTNPTVTLNDPNSGTPVALRGRVPVKVCSEGGVINPGDPLTSSSLKGHAMKASGKSYIVGRALERFDGNESGMILCLLENGWNDSDAGSSPISSGTFSLIKGKNEVTLFDQNISKDSKAFITMLGDPGCRYWVREKKDGQITIALSADAATDVSFDYLIENAKSKAVNSTESFEASTVLTSDDAQKMANIDLGEWEYDEEKGVYWKEELPQPNAKRLEGPELVDLTPPPAPEDPNKSYIYSNSTGLVEQKIKR